MAARKRTRGERETDLVVVSQLYLQGWSHQAIADVLNAERAYTLSRSQISRDIATLLERWRETYLVDFNEAQVHELARLDELERQYWQAWECSQHDSISTQEVDIQDELNDYQSYSRRKLVKKTEKQTGREAYLQGVQWCINQRCKILGLMAPKTVNVNWRKEAETMGINSSEILDNLVNQFVAAAENGKKNLEQKPPPNLDLGD